MRLPTAIVRATCRLMLAVMLFAQWSIAAYACEGTLAMQAAQVAVQDATDMPTDCEMAKGQDGSKDTLCLEHCRFGQQSSDTASVPAVFVAVPVLLYALPNVADVEAGESLHLAALPAHAGAPPTPPHAVLHCVWRI